MTMMTMINGRNCDGVKKYRDLAVLLFGFISHEI